MTSGYQPFAITKFETGQFQYYQPWISPDDAFDPLINAYIFRGQLQKRLGTSVFGLTGSLRYRNNQIIASGNGGSSYSGTLSAFPIEAGSMNVIAAESGGIETFTDDSNENLSGSLGGSGMIDYTTGVWSITTGGNVALTIPIVGAYTFTANKSGLVRPIMMITEFINEQDDNHIVVAADTRRFAKFNTATELFDPIDSFSQINFVVTSKNTLAQTFTLTTGFANLAPYSVTLTIGSTTITDNGDTTFTPVAPFASASVNYSTGVITMMVSSIPVSPATYSVVVEANLQGDYFTGTFANLFNYVNWRASPQDTSHLYMTNNVDRVTLFDGTNLSRPALSITNADYINFVNDIATCLDVKVFQNSLLLSRPRTVGSSFPDAQMIRFSAVQNPFNFVADVPGNGGSVSAPTGDWLQSVSYLLDILVCEFEDSCFIFKYTGAPSEPFVFRKINSSKSCNAPYGSIEYDTITTSMGAKGLCQVDGVNKDRYDLDAIDLYKDISDTNFSICQGKRFDDLQQSWMIYPSISRPDSNTNCDKVIVYNWIEGTWATYQINLSCLGSGKTYKDTTWLSIGSRAWIEFNIPWNALVTKKLVPWMLGGDTKGVIYFLNDVNNDFDKTEEIIDASIVSKRWNPFVEQGQKAVYGYVDFYYKVGLNSQGNPIKLQLEWFVNNSNNPALVQNMTLDTPATGDPAPNNYNIYAFKRMYLNLSGQFLRLEINSSEFPQDQGQFIIAGMVLWAKPAGRLTPGTFL